MTIVTEAARKAKLSRRKKSSNKTDKAEVLWHPITTCYLSMFGQRSGCWQYFDTCCVSYRCADSAISSACGKRAS